MTDLIYDYITLGVDMMISGAILASVIVLLRSSAILSTYASNQQQVSDRIGYYREYAMYDCTQELLSPDVLSTITYYRYSLEVVINMGNNVIYNDRNSGKYYLKEGSNNPIEISHDTLVSRIGTSNMFKAYLWEDFQKTGANYNLSTGGYQGGVVTGIQFTQYYY